MEIQNTTLHGKHHFIFYIQIRFNLFVEQVPYKLFFTIFNRYIRPIYFLSSRVHKERIKKKKRKKIRKSRTIRTNVRVNIETNGEMARRVALVPV